MNRYTHPEIDQIWSAEATLERWTQIELAHLKALSQDVTDLIPELINLNPQALTIDPMAVRTREHRTGHDVGAFLELLEEKMLQFGLDQCARWLHWGLTSSDLVDTGVSMAVFQSMKVLYSDLFDLQAEIANLPNTEVVGRTHGQPASPTTLRERFSSTYGLFGNTVIHDWFPVMLSGAVGQYRVFSKDRARDAASILGGELIEHTTQVMPPEWVMAEVSSVLIWVTGCEQIATNLRLMANLGEYIPAAPKVGSSTMPAKINPYLAERVCGLAKVWRGLYDAFISSRVLWLERDLHHSSVDRMTLPELFRLAGYMVRLCTQLLQEATWPPQDLSQFEPAIDADVLLADSVAAVNLPRSVVYAAVRDAIWAETSEKSRPTTEGVRDRLGWFHDGQ